MKVTGHTTAHVFCHYDIGDVPGRSTVASLAERRSEWCNPRSAQFSHSLRLQPSGDACKPAKFHLRAVSSVGRASAF